LRQRAHLKSPGKELVLDLEEVALALLREEGFIDDLEPHIILHVLPATVTMTTHSSRKLYGFSFVVIIIIITFER